MKPFLSLLIVLLLTACGGGGSSQATTDTGPNKVTNAITVQNQEFEVKKGIELSKSLSATHSANSTITFEVIEPPTIGNFQLSATGQFTFTVDKFESAENAKFTFSAKSPNTPTKNATVVINLLAPDNIIPITNGAIHQVAVDSVYQNTVEAFDTDGDQLTYALETNVTQGKLEFNKQTGEFSYYAPLTPNDTQTNFSYRVFDGLAWSNVSQTVLNFQPASNELSRYSYLSYGNTTDVISGIFILPNEITGKDFVYQGQANIMAQPRFGSIKLTNNGFTYHPNKALLEQSISSTDRTIVSIKDETGKVHMLRYEFVLKDHQIETVGNELEPLAPNWRDENDFPEILQQILAGDDPFHDSFIHSDEMFMQAIKAIDTLALHSNITNENIEKLTYYVRAHIYKFWPKILTEEQLVALDTASFRLSQMQGFYGLSQSAAKLHVGLRDSSYVLVYYEEKTPLLEKYFSINLALFNLYSRFAGVDYTYELQEGIYASINYIDRITYVFKHIDDQSFAQQHYNDYLLNALTNLANSKLVPIEQDYFILFNIYALGYELWLNNDPNWQTKLDEAVTAITENVLVKANEEDGKQIKIHFYSYYLSSAVGHQNPDLAISQCNGVYADICHIVTEQEVLPNTLICGEAAEIKFDSINDEGQDRLCSALISTEERFHQVLQTNKIPVEHDFNEEITASIFNSPQDYDAYGYVLYNISTDNGGIYIEGTPSNPNNQAHFFVYQQGADDEWWVWNWEHEFSHYLDGRYVQYGEFGYFPLEQVTWWSEGLAEYVAWMNDFPRGNYVITTTPESEWPSIEQITQVSYNSSSAMIYSWSYTLHRFLVENHNDTHQAIKHCLRAGDLTCYNQKIQSMTEWDSEYQTWLKELATSIKSSPSIKRYNHNDYLRDLQQLRLHSKKHYSTQQNTPMNSKNDVL